MFIIKNKMGLMGPAPAPTPNIAFFFRKACFLHQTLHFSFAFDTFCIKHRIFLSHLIIFASNIAFFLRKAYFLDQILHYSFAKDTFCIKQSIFKRFTASPELNILFEKIFALQIKNGWSEN